MLELATELVEYVIPKHENRFAVLAFLWSVFVVGRKRRNGSWEDDAISVCDIIRCISIPLFHQSPVEWIFIFSTSSVFSFILQEKHFLGLVLLSSLQLVLYFLLLGLSPMTYWNFGKQFFNLVVMPDDPRQLLFDMGIHLALAVMALHFLVAIALKFMEYVRIDWLLFSLIVHPSVTFYLFPSHSSLSILGVGFSALLITIKYQKEHLTTALGVMFLYYYNQLLSAH